jgi:Ca2+-binding EF-hand superfamily protein
VSTFRSTVIWVAPTSQVGSDLRGADLQVGHGQRLSLCWYRSRTLAPQEGGVVRAGWYAAVLVVVIGAAGPSPAAAQDTASGTRFRGFDRNGDGVITRDEWQGSERSFEVHDWNRDGVLSGDELRRGARRGQAWPDDPDEDYRFSDWTAQRFDELDHNRDGRLTRDEWHFDAELFRRVDLDRDGSISRSEFLGTAGDDDRDDRFEDLDVNRDGRLSGAEWHGDPVLFGTLDRDRDGFLSRAELGAGSADEVSANLFDNLDVNRDGVIGISEWHWSRASFERRDRNRDGSLSRAEFEAVTAQTIRRTGAYDAGYARGLQDGRQAGREDRQHNRWDLEGQRELEQADAGYAPAVGARSEYQAGYREGFKRGYGEGFGPR